MSMTKEVEVKEEISQREKVRKLVLKLGVSPALKGFNYIISAVNYLLSNQGVSITQLVYPTVAEEYGTTGTRVERAIRHALENLTLNYGSIEHIEEVLDCKILSDRIKNSEFFYYCTDYLLHN